MNEHHKHTYLVAATEDRPNEAVRKLKSYYDSHIPSVKTLIISQDIHNYLQNSYYIDYIPYKLPKENCIFSEHLSPSELLPRIKSGDLFQGVFHVMRYDLTKAWVSITQGFLQKYK